MGIRDWLRKSSEAEARGEDLPPRPSLMQALFGREQTPTRALGEYDEKSYPADVALQLRRRQEVADELMQIDLTDRTERQQAIPRIKELLRIYPHPLAYETLILAYLDGERYDEARGVAFAARERRLECSRSPYSEIRGETDRLSEWTPEDVELVQAEKEGRIPPPAPIPPRRSGRGRER